MIRGVRPFLVTYKGERRTVELPGYYPEGEGEGVHIGVDLQAVPYQPIMRIRGRCCSPEPKA